VLGRKDFTRDEIDRAKAVIDQQLATYRGLAEATSGGASEAALAAFEPAFFDGLVLALDRFFVHRVRAVSGKDANPLNEVELLVESLLVGDTLRTNKVIKWVPENTVLGLADGDPIALTEAQFTALAAAFFTELESRFLPA
jgi:hypothetical protein